MHEPGEKQGPAADRPGKENLVIADVEQDGGKLADQQGAGHNHDHGETENEIQHDIVHGKEAEPYHQSEQGEQQKLAEKILLFLAKNSRAGLLLTEIHGQFSPEKAFKVLIIYPQPLNGFSKKPDNCNNMPDHRLLFVKGSEQLIGIIALVFISGQLGEEALQGIGAPGFQLLEGAIGHHDPVVQQ